MTNDASVGFFECATMRDSMRGGRGVWQGNYEARQGLLLQARPGTTMAKRRSALLVAKSKLGAFFQRLRLHNHDLDSKRVLHECRQPFGNVLHLWTNSCSNLSNNDKIKTFSIGKVVVFIWTARHAARLSPSPPLIWPFHLSSKFRFVLDDIDFLSLFFSISLHL